MKTFFSKTTHVGLRSVDGVVDPAAGLLHADAPPLGLFWCLEFEEAVKRK